MRNVVPRGLIAATTALFAYLLTASAGCTDRQSHTPSHAEIEKHDADQVETTTEPMKPHTTFSVSAAEANRLIAEARVRGMPPDGLLLIANTTTQRAVLADSREIILEYLMSSSKFGTGSQIHSNKTPLGWHKVVERFGGDLLHGSIFKARQPQKRILRPDEWRNDDDGDFVLTRILWLDGLEPGVNQGGSLDTYTRCIYIHGTNQEHLLGKPASHGCIRLSNRDVMELFDLTEGRELYCFIQ